MRGGARQGGRVRVKDERRPIRAASGALAARIRERLPRRYRSRANARDAHDARRARAKARSSNPLPRIARADCPYRSPRKMASRCERMSHAM